MKSEVCLCHRVKRQRLYAVCIRANGMTHSLCDIVALYNLNSGVYTLCVCQMQIDYSCRQRRTQSQRGFVGTS